MLSGRSSLYLSLLRITLPARVSTVLSAWFVVISLNFIDTDGALRALSANLSRILMTSGLFCPAELRENRRKSRSMAEMDLILNAFTQDASKSVPKL
jgi:Na+-transporting NADH:ubiquinone oxidoreductase subunit NqrD